MTNEEFEARIDDLETEIEDIYDEIDAIEIAQGVQYMVEEGFWEVERIDDENYALYPIEEAADIEVPV